ASARAVASAKVDSAATALDTAWHELPGEPIAPAEGLALEFTPYEPVWITGRSLPSGPARGLN
ncbi:hypothetical protein IAE22_35690, partial [Bacillus sp. S34]|nr:hypothetical protein [Bacillus sp. S34]